MKNNGIKLESIQDAREIVADLIVEAISSTDEKELTRLEKIGNALKIYMDSFGADAMSSLNTLASLLPLDKRM